MKKFKLFLLALLVAVIAIGCSDDDDDTTTITCKILSEMLEMNDGTRYSEYVYDTISGNLVKINYSETDTSDIYSCDTLIYNSSEQLISVMEYSPGSVNADETINYTYTNGKITKIVETGARWDEENQEEVIYTSTANFTYSGSDLATITVSGDGENMGFKDFTYSGSNLITLKVDFFGNDTVWAGIEAILYDSKNNLNNYLVPSWDNILFGASDNNMLLLVMTDSVVMGDNVMHIGDTLFNQTYTYNMYDQVETVTSHPSAMERETALNTYKWECKEE